MFEKIKLWGQEILAKIGVISHEVEGYIVMAITAGDTILKWIKNPPTEVTIRALFPGITDGLYQKVEAAMVDAIKYLTQSEDILNAGSPDKMLAAFIADLQKDAPGLQTSKIFTIVSKIVGFLDGNSMIGSIYRYLVQKYFTKKAVGA